MHTFYVMIIDVGVMIIDDDVMPMCTYIYLCDTCNMSGMCDVCIAKDDSLVAIIAIKLHLFILFMGQNGGFTALMWAVKNQNVEDIALLLKHGAAVDVSTQLPAL